jgi:hypothetical protein
MHKVLKCVHCPRAATHPMFGGRKRYCLGCYVKSEQPYKPLYTRRTRPKRK